MSSAIPQDIVQTAKETIFNDKLRSFSVFFGIGEEDSYSLTFGSLWNRFTNNIMYFYLNYVLMALVIMVITLFATMINPAKIIMLVALGVAWFFVMRNGSFELCDGKINITQKQTTTVMIIITAVVAFFIVKVVFFVSIGSSLLLAFIHAVVRDASRHYNTGDALVNENEFTNVGGVENNPV